MNDDATDEDDDAVTDDDDDDYDDDDDDDYDDDDYADVISISTPPALSASCEPINVEPPSFEMHQKL